MKRTFLVIVLAVALLLAGCSEEVKNHSPVLRGNPGSYEEPVATYDWMAGESPVPNRRMGILRVGLQNYVHAVSATGAYFRVLEDGKYYIMYMDNGSDKLIKLCGRPDCNHDNEDCNAYLPMCGGLSYFKGYLYALYGTEPESKLIRMDPDGSNRVELLDLQAFAKEQGGDFVRCELMTEGVVLLYTNRWVVTNTDNGGTSLKSELMDYYFYKLDGSMDKPVLQRSRGVMYNCGNTVISYSLEAKRGGQYGSYWSWNPDTEEQVYIADHPGVPGYVDENAGYYFHDGAIYRLDCKSHTEEIMLETGLEGKYLLHSFPDCLVLSSRGLSETADRHLYFYNWNFELVDTVELTYDINRAASEAIITETAERLILQDSLNRPAYYIEKSELGMGNAKVHAFNMP